MAINRITQNMMARRSTESLQNNLSRMSRLQEQLSSGKTINRPSDDPSGTATSMRLQSTLDTIQQYSRNISDGMGWLNLTDSTLDSMTQVTQKVRDIGLQGANSGTTSAASREAMAQTVEQLRGAMISAANTNYNGRPLFGGITAGDVAYDASGTFTGESGVVNRTVADGVQVRVDTDAATAFGPTGDNVFGHFTELATALRSGDTTAITTATGKVNADLDRIVAARTEAGTRSHRLEIADQKATDDELAVTTSLSNVQNIDLPRTIMDMQMQQTAYQAALGATSRVLQPSLLDFLR